MTQQAHTHTRTSADPERFEIWEARREAQARRDNAAHYRSLELQAYREAMDAAWSDAEWHLARWSARNWLPENAESAAGILADLRAVLAERDLRSAEEYIAQLARKESRERAVQEAA
jgi:hypothetical protein